jgi:aspartate ammonia-lyase
MLKHSIKYYSADNLGQRVRLETDLLGTRNIDYDVLWGIHTLRALENFNISTQKISDIPEMIWGMVAVKKASALANTELGVLSAEKSAAIVAACDDIMKDNQFDSHFPLDPFQGGAGTSLNMNANEVVANLALEKMGHARGDYQYLSPNDDVNKSQSTNCAYPTGFRLAIYKKLLVLVEAIKALEDQLMKKSSEYQNVLKMGRTQLQDAVPMTFGQEFRAFATLLKEEIKNLHYTAELILEVNLGATAIGTGVNTPKGYQKTALKHLAEITEFDVRPAEDLIEATSDCGAFVMMHSAIKRLAVKLSKISNDLRLLSSGPRAGLNEINLPQLQAGSSIMPAKVNPVIPEVVNQVCFKVIGNDMTITMAAEAGQLQLNAMEPVIAQCMFESMSLLTNAITTLSEKCIRGLTVNIEICNAMVQNSIGIITYLTPHIGHHQGDRIGQICALSGRSVRAVCLEQNILDEAQLDAILDFDHLINPEFPIE